jgi:hypothetical protein
VKLGKIEVNAAARAPGPAVLAPVELGKIEVDAASAVAGG